MPESEHALMVFKVVYSVYGGHAHCGLFVAQAPDRTFALAGTFMLRLHELEALQAACPKIQFLARTEKTAGAGTADAR